MHVIDLFNSGMFDVEVAGKAGSISDVFPDWTPHDRFGILIYEPLGGVGATHLIQIACTSFYDVKPARRTERKIYPEIYAFHVGRWWGSHVSYDFWPSRREFRVSDDHREILDAINDRSITRLAIPEREPRDLVHRNKEEDAALDRMITTVMYSATGRVSNPDFTIKGNDRRTERDPQRVIRPIVITEAITAQAGASGTAVKESEAAYRAWVTVHSNDITEEERAEADRRRMKIREDGLVTESYRFVPPVECLKCL